MAASWLTSDERERRGEEDAAAVVRVAVAFDVAVGAEAVHGLAHRRRRHPLVLAQCRQCLRAFLDQVGEDGDGRVPEIAALAFGPEAAIHAADRGAERCAEVLGHDC